MTVSFRELASWFITMVSVVLFVTRLYVERKQNPRLSYYMAIQGILRAVKTKAGSYAALLSSVEDRRAAGDDTVSMYEYLLLIKSVYSDYASLLDHIMGSLKGIEPLRDVPFDTDEFLKRARRTEVPDSNSTP